MNTGTVATLKRRQISVNPDIVLLYMVIALRTLDITAKFVVVLWCSAVVA